MRFLRFLAFLTLAALVTVPTARAQQSATAEPVKMGDTRADVKRKLGEPRSETSAGVRHIMIYPQGEILLENDHVTEAPGTVLNPPPVPVASRPAIAVNSPSSAGTVDSATASPATTAPAGTPALEAGTMDPRLAAAKKIVDAMKFEKGVINVNNGLAKINLPEDFRYLNAADSATLLNKIWGNPPDDPPLGMIVPANFDPFDEHAWAVVIRFTDDGYVKDDDAATIDYTKLLADMKSGFEEQNKERAEKGYPPMDLIGWAEPPHYDAATHKLYWAKELKIGDDPGHTLNYNIRLLGRRGVLVLNAIAAMPDLKLVKEASPKIIAMVDFQDGHRYADFNASTDKVAAYGIAALVAGGLAAKAGLLKGVWIALLAAKKFIVIGVLALGAFIKKLYNRLTGRSGSKEG